MGAYAYCPSCHAPLGPPTAREVVEGERDCRHCGKTMGVQDTLADLIERLESRIEDLEKEAGIGED